MKTIQTGINGIILEWKDDAAKELKASGRRFSSHQFHVRTSTKKDFGTGCIRSVGVKIDKHGVFFEKGVGRGRGIGSGKETPNPWFNPVMEKMAPKLADDLGLEVSNILARALIK